MCACECMCVEQNSGLLYKLESPWAHFECFFFNIWWKQQKWCVYVFAWDVIDVQNDIKHVNGSLEVWPFCITKLAI